MENISLSENTNKIFQQRKAHFSVISEVANHVSSLLVIINASTNVFIYLYKHEESIPGIVEMVSKILIICI